MGNFQKVLNKDDLADGQGTCVEVQGRRIAIFNVAGSFHALDDECSHAEASLSEGALVNGGEVECPWHGARFDLKTGQPKCLPAVKGVRTYPVRVQGGNVEIELD